jgi:TatD DNase family protein
VDNFFCYYVLMKYTYIDMHSHLNLSPLWEEREVITSKMRESGVSTITVSVDFETSKRAIELAEQYPDVCIGATVGQHPNDNPEEVFEYEKYLGLAKHPKVVAIGECGLDYFRLNGSDEEKVKEIERQKKLLRTHIKLATETGLPLMIHARPSKDSRSDTYIDVLDILDDMKFTGKADFHFYVGDLETTKKIVEKGYSMSFDGPITFSSDYDEVIAYIPLEQIMAETDAPFATPMPYRGQTNYPYYVGEVYKKIAEIKKSSVTEVTEQILKNITSFFRL